MTSLATVELGTRFSLESPSDVVGTEGLHFTAETTGYLYRG